MTMHLVLMLLTIIATTSGEVYQLPPQGFVPPNHKPPLIYHAPQIQESQPQSAENIHHLEPFATMEIFKDRNSPRTQIQPNYQIIPDNHKPIHVEVQRVPDSQEIEPETPVDIPEAEQASTVNRESDLASALSNLDFFADSGRGFKTKAAISAPPAASQLFTTAFPNTEIVSGGESVGRPSRYYPVQHNKFATATDFYTPGIGHKANIKSLEKLVNQGPLKKYKPKKKFNSKIQKFPKKFKTNIKNNKLRVPHSGLDGFSNKPTLQQLNDKLQIKPVSEVEDFSLDSLKNKRKIPLSYYQEPHREENSFNGELGAYKSFPNHKPSSHADFSLPSGGSNNGDRVEFQMYGMDGPDSYKFGYDTGKGHNRHFRYEERDNHGKIKGHYGFYDQEGKMSMMHYEADPHTGFRAGPYHHPENHHEYH